MKTIIFDFNRTLYDPIARQLIPGAMAVLDKLQAREYTLGLISRQGEQRQNIINDLGIATYFATVVLTAQKTVADFQRIAKDSTTTFVVGDRIRDEIYLGNQLGYTTIWLQTGKFSTELPRNDRERPTHVIHQLTDLLEITP